MSPFAWIAIGFVVGAICGGWLILYFLASMQANLVRMLHQTPKDK